MNKVAHYNGFVGRCQRYGLTKQAADMLYKQGLFGLTKKQASNNPSKYQSNGWAPKDAPTPNYKPWLHYYPRTSIPHLPKNPGHRDTLEVGTWALPADDYFMRKERVRLAGGGMNKEQELYSRANPNFAGWFNAHTESFNKVRDKYPEIGEMDFSEYPEILADMSKTYHDSMYNLTNGTPMVSMPMPAKR